MTAEIPTAPIYKMIHTTADSAAEFAQRGIVVRVVCVPVAPIVAKI